jgi:hypothetical protein
MTSTTTTATRTQTIVVAWTEVIDVVAPGTTWRHDLGERPKMTQEVVGRAATWLLSGTKSDVTKAREYAAKNGMHVFCYSTTERDPLARARRDAVQLHGGV